MFDPFTTKTSLVILLTAAIQFWWCLFGEFGIGSTYIPLVSIFLYSHLLSAWYTWTFTVTFCGIFSPPLSTDANSPTSLLDFIRRRVGVGELTVIQNTRVVITTTGKKFANILFPKIKKTQNPVKAIPMLHSPPFPTPCRSTPKNNSSACATLRGTIYNIHIILTMDH